MQQLSVEEREVEKIAKLRSELSLETIMRFIGKIAWRRQQKLAQKDNFDEKYPEDWLSAFLVSGKSYFDKATLLARRIELLTFKPFKTMSNGEAKLFRPRVAHRRYVIGADAATGRTVSSADTDNCAAAVIDLESGEDMAGYCAHVRPEDFAYDLADLGTYYNNAEIAVERTGDGGTTILTLAGDCQYGNIYKHKEWHQRDKTVVEVEGFPTTRKTRPIALNFLNSFIIDHPELIHDARFLQEALVFTRDEKGIPRGANGSHDDTVSARWIAYYVRQVLLGYHVPWEAKTEKYVDAGRIIATAG